MKFIKIYEEFDDQSFNAIKEIVEDIMTEISDEFNFMYDEKINNNYITFSYFLSIPKNKEVSFIKMQKNVENRLKTKFDNIKELSNEKKQYKTSDGKYIYSLNFSIKLPNIEKFEKFNQITDDILNIFDFDDTLVDTPSFDKLAIDHLKEGVTIKSLLKKSLEMINAKVEDLQIEDGRIFIKDIKKEIDVKGNWVRRKDRVYLFSPDKFYYTDLSLPKKVTKIAEIYNSSKNKAIVTGRVKSMEEKVRRSMKDLGLEDPNFGLHCYPTKSQSGDKVAEWKGKTIIKIIKESKIDSVVFYEDNRKWLNVVTKMVKESLPDIKFKGIKV